MSAWLVEHGRSRGVYLEFDMFFQCMNFVKHQHLIAR
jgi:hypothetical protein